jgi:chromosome segregation ATPase
MNVEQIEKQLEWLEKERRADKQVISSLKKQIASLEEKLEQANKDIQALETEQAKFGVRLTKMDSYDDALAAHRKEVKKEIDAQEKRTKKRESYAKEKYEKQISDLGKEIIRVEQGLTKIPPLRDSIEILKRDTVGRDRAIAELEVSLREIKDKDLDLKQSIQVLEEDQRSDKKRITDVQGEVTAVRKRLEEYRAQYDMAEEARKKMDSRINELLASEDERRDAQRDFIEESSRNKMDVEKSFTEWTKRFAAIEERAETLTTALQTYSEIEVSLRRAQSEFDNIIEQISRRIHEITEMQRLGEDRFRQEWTTFKSDDQKRWVNYTLTQEEQTKESIRRSERLTERLTTMEELLQDMQDSVEQNSEQMGNLMQGFSSVLGDWLSANDRSSDTR